jgi:DNA-binding CsgD family transcriptional regulator
MSLDDSSTTNAVLVRDIKEAEAWTRISLWNGERFLWLYGPPFDTYVPGARDETACPLSSRELDILELVSEGNSNAATGRLLGLSALTVKSHLCRISKKLGTGDRTRMVAIAIRSGWIE